MRKLIIIAVVFLTSCEQLKTTQEKATDGSVKYSSLTTTITVFEIDSCEYVVVQTGNGVSVVHKENCKFCTP